LLHLIGSSILLYLIDDARPNKNQVNCVYFSRVVQSSNGVMQGTLRLWSFIQL